MSDVGGGRVLKTLLCVHDQGGLVVVKVVTLNCLRHCVVGPSHPSCAARRSTTKQVVM